MREMCWRMSGSRPDPCLSFVCSLPSRFLEWRSPHTLGRRDGSSSLPSSLRVRTEFYIYIYERQGKNAERKIQEKNKKKQKTHH